MPKRKKPGRPTNKKDVSTDEHVLQSLEQPVPAKKSTVSSTSQLEEMPKLKKRGSPRNNIAVSSAESVNKSEDKPSPAKKRTTRSSMCRLEDEAVTASSYSNVSLHSSKNADSRKTPTPLPHYYCNYCTFSTDSNNVFAEHKQTHMNKCPKCSFYSFSDQDIFHHIKNEHDKDIDSAFDTVSEIDKDPCWMCLFCNFLTYSTDYLERHTAEKHPGMLRNSTNILISRKVSCKVRTSDAVFYLNSSESMGNSCSELDSSSNTGLKLNTLIIDTSVENAEVKKVECSPSPITTQYTVSPVETKQFRNPVKDELANGIYSDILNSNGVNVETRDTAVDVKANTSVSVKVEALHCLTCSYNNVSVDKLKCHTVIQHPVSAAVATYSPSGDSVSAQDIAFFCVRNNCSHSSLKCSSFQAHLMDCCGGQKSLTVLEKERLKSTITYIFECKRKYRFTVEDGFTAFASSYLDISKLVNQVVVIPSPSDVETKPCLPSTDKGSQSLEPRLPFPPSDNSLSNLDHVSSCNNLNSPVVMPSVGQGGNCQISDSNNRSVSQHLLFPISVVLPGINTDQSQFVNAHNSDISIHIGNVPSNLPEDVNFRLHQSGQYPNTQAATATSQNFHSKQMDSSIQSLIRDQWQSKQVNNSCYLGQNTITSPASTAAQSKQYFRLPAQNKQQSFSGPLSQNSPMCNAAQGQNNASSSLLMQNIQFSQNGKDLTSNTGSTTSSVNSNNNLGFHPNPTQGKPCSLTQSSQQSFSSALASQSCLAQEKPVFFTTANLSQDITSRLNQTSMVSLSNTKVSQTITECQQPGIFAAGIRMDLACRLNQPSAESLSEMCQQQQSGIFTTYTSSGSIDLTLDRVTHVGQTISQVKQPANLISANKSQGKTSGLNLPPLARNSNVGQAGFQQPGIFTNPNISQSITSRQNQSPQTSTPNVGRAGFQQPGSFTNPNINRVVTNRLNQSSQSNSNVESAGYQQPGIFTNSNINQGMTSRLNQSPQSNSNVDPAGFQRPDIFTNSNINQGITSRRNQSPQTSNSNVGQAGFQQPGIFTNPNISQSITSRQNQSPQTSTPNVGRAGFQQPGSFTNPNIHQVVTNRLNQSSQSNSNVESAGYQQPGIFTNSNINQGMTSRLNQSPQSNSNVDPAGFQRPDFFTNSNINQGMTSRLNQSPQASSPNVGQSGCQLSGVLSTANLGRSLTSSQYQSPHTDQTDCQPKQPIILTTVNLNNDPAYILDQSLLGRGSDVGQTTYQTKQPDNLTAAIISRSLDQCIVGNISYMNQNQIDKQQPSMLKANINQDLTYRCNQNSLSSVDSAAANQVFTGQLSPATQSQQETSNLPPNSNVRLQLEGLSSKGEIPVLISGNYSQPQITPSSFCQATPANTETQLMVQQTSSVTPQRHLTGVRPIYHKEINSHSPIISSSSMQSSGIQTPLSLPNQSNLQTPIKESFNNLNSGFQATHFSSSSTFLHGAVMSEHPSYVQSMSHQSPIITTGPSSSRTAQVLPTVATSSSYGPHTATEQMPAVQSATSTSLKSVNTTSGSSVPSLSPSIHLNSTGHTDNSQGFINVGRGSRGTTLASNRGNPRNQGVRQRISTRERGHLGTHRGSSSRGRIRTPRMSHTAIGGGDDEDVIVTAVTKVPPQQQQRFHQRNRPPGRGLSTMPRGRRQVSHIGNQSNSRISRSGACNIHSQTPPTHQSQQKFDVIQNCEDLTCEVNDDIEILGVTHGKDTDKISEAIFMDPGEFSYCCLQCGKDQGSKNGVKQHMKAHHSDSPLAAITHKETGNLLFICLHPRCEFVTYSEKNLKEHISKCYDLNKSRPFVLEKAIKNLKIWQFSVQSSGRRRISPIDLADQGMKDNFNNNLSDAFSSIVKTSGRPTSVPPGISETQALPEKEMIRAKVPFRNRSSASSCSRIRMPSPSPQANVDNRILTLHHPQQQSAKTRGHFQQSLPARMSVNASVNQKQQPSHQASLGQKQLSAPHDQPVAPAKKALKSSSKSVQHPFVIVLDGDSPEYLEETVKHPTADKEHHLGVSNVTSAKKSGSSFRTVRNKTMLQECAKLHGSTTVSKPQEPARKGSVGNNIVITDQSIQARAVFSNNLATSFSTASANHPGPCPVKKVTANRPDLKCGFNLSQNRNTPQAVSYSKPCELNVTSGKSKSTPKAAAHKHNTNTFTPSSSQHYKVTSSAAMSSVNEAPALLSASPMVRSVVTESGRCYAENYNKSLTACSVTSPLADSAQLKPNCMADCIVIEEENTVVQLQNTKEPSLPRNLPIKNCTVTSTTGSSWLNTSCITESTVGKKTSLALENCIPKVPLEIPKTLPDKLIAKFKEFAKHRTETITSDSTIITDSVHEGSMVDKSSGRMHQKPVLAQRGESSIKSVKKTLVSSQSNVVSTSLEVSASSVTASQSGAVKDTEDGLMTSSTAGICSSVNLVHDLTLDSDVEEQQETDESEELSKSAFKSKDIVKNEVHCSATSASTVLKSAAVSTKISEQRQVSRQQKATCNQVSSGSHEVIEDVQSIYLRKNIQDHTSRADVPSKRSDSLPNLETTVSNAIGINAFSKENIINLPSASSPDSATIASSEASTKALSPVLQDHAVETFKDPAVVDIQTVKECDLTPTEITSSVDNNAVVSPDLRADIAGEPCNQERVLMDYEEIQPSNQAVKECEYTDNNSQVLTQKVESKKVVRGMKQFIVGNTDKRLLKKKKGKTRKLFNSEEKDGEENKETTVKDNFIRRSLRMHKPVINYQCYANEIDELMSEDDDEYKVTYDDYGTDSEAEWSETPKETTRKKVKKTVMSSDPTAFCITTKGCFKCWMCRKSFSRCSFIKTHIMRTHDAGFCAIDIGRSMETNSLCMVLFCPRACTYATTTLEAINNHVINCSEDILQDKGKNCLELGRQFLDSKYSELINMGLEAALVTTKVRKPKDPKNPLKPKKPRKTSDKCAASMISSDDSIYVDATSNDAAVDKSFVSPTFQQISSSTGAHTPASRTHQMQQTASLLPAASPLQTQISNQNKLQLQMPCSSQISGHFTRAPVAFKRTPWKNTQSAMRSHSRPPLPLGNNQQQIPVSRTLPQTGSSVSQHPFDTSVPTPGKQTEERDNIIFVVEENGTICLD